MLERVVYVGGAARSGTTALGRALAVSEGAVWAGELVWLPRDLQEDRRCSCGEVASRCPFWREVRARLGWSDSDLTAKRFGEGRPNGGRSMRSLLWRGLGA